MTESHDRTILSRREFVRRSAATGSLIALSGCGAAPRGQSCQCNGPTPTQHLIPADKALPQAWLDSLVRRGQPEVWSGEQLRYIGMPIGGIGCGQLYLAGDGRLWLWEIFKCNYSRESADGWPLSKMTSCGHYIQPVDSTTGHYHPDMGAQVDQGFAIRLTCDGRTQTRTLDAKGFADVTFRGEYPIGRVVYTDKACPVRVELEAFSPFIPLDARSSAQPATVMAYTITNTGTQAAEVSLLGWLQNAVNPYDNDPKLGNRTSVLVQFDESAQLNHSVQPNPHIPQEQGLFSRHGYGSMSLTLLKPDRSALRGGLPLTLPLNDEPFTEPWERTRSVTRPLDTKLIGALGQAMTLEPGQSRTVEFVLTWYFPYYQQRNGQMTRIRDFDNLHRHYQPWHNNALDVAGLFYRKDDDRLVGLTRLWNQTWYDSTLPYWLLDRCFIPTDALATNTVHWFSNGRFWGWEGVNCCPGTCTHVWNYAQAMARLFPELERDMRQRVDFGLALKEDGGIRYRGEFNDRVATDGQGGIIMRAWREHTLSPDDSFLRSVWPKVKKAIDYLVRMDGDGNGLLEGSQSHTLDASWDGPMGWISSIYNGALRAGAAMAEEMGDAAFARRCREIADRGKQNMVDQLFNGEYFIHLPPNHDKINTNRGCHIDQVLGQSWACQYGLPRVLPGKQTVSALNALWKYNFAPDAGGYAIAHQAIKAHRIYAMPGEAGLMMTTWPHGGADVAVPGMDKMSDELKKWQGPGGYFDENMTGYEYQVAAHMIYEGQPGSDLVRQGLAIARAIHDRYAPSRRNPYNEIECSDHYSRAMAAYGVFLGVCGFEYHGPKGYLAFSPRITPDNFKAAFTAAQGWGTFTQNRTARQQTERIEVKHGQLRVKTLAFDLSTHAKTKSVKVALHDKAIKATYNQRADHVTIQLAEPLVVRDNALNITIVH